MYWNEECLYYEPTIADKLMMEYQEKMKDALLESVKKEIEQIKNENIRLKEENTKYKEREISIANKEQELKYKEENLKREVEREFYQSNIGDTLKRYLEDCEVWITELEYYQQQKCSLCNEERYLIAKFPNGEIIKTECNCAKVLKKYIPALSTMTLIKFSKRNSMYPSDRHFYLDRTYSPPNNRGSFDYDYQKFNSIHIVDKFDENVIEMHKNKRYDEKIGFRSKEECQKYCDWLNSENK